MPYSGKGTDEEITQRQEAARTHGAYAFRDRGEQALEQPQRSRLEELKEQVQERAGVLTLMQERAANAVMMAELVTSYIAREVKSGIPLSQINAVRVLPAFMNTANRALAQLYAMLPDDKDVLDVGEMIAQAVIDHEQNS